MLPVSDLIELARTGNSGDDLRSGVPLRYGGPTSCPPVVVWNVCMHCNMSCPHCYAAAVAEPAPSDLGTEDGLRLLGEMAECGVKVVIFSGGEPLLRPDLFKLLVHARNVGLAPQLSTNGVRVDGSVARRLTLCGVAYVGVSVDGRRAFNDDYRGLTGGFDAALEGLRQAKAAGMRTGLRMTLTRRNADQLEAMLEVADSVDADRFYLSHLLYSGRGYGVAADDLSRSEVRSMLETLFGCADAQVSAGPGPRVVTGSNDSDGPFLLRWIERHYGRDAAHPVRELLRRRGGNSAGERILNIDSRGRAHPDQFWRSAVLGDVRKQSFSEILRHPLREELRTRLDRLKGRCGTCTERALCRGSHRERALAIYRDPWASDPACVLEDAEIGLEADTPPNPACEVA